jgi:flavin reductase (DIM6/NTAB) family NADH-FMN oxidoreductase RutF
VDGAGSDQSRRHQRGAEEPRSQIIADERLVGKGAAIEDDHAFDSRQFRNALGRFASGVTVITTQHEGHTHGMTANAFVSVSLDPPLVLVSLDNRAHMHWLLPMSQRYGVSILSVDQEALSDHFAGRTQEGLRIPFVTRHGMALVDGALAHLVARVVQVHPAGDHTVYVGHVEYIAWRDDRPLLFYAGQYRQLQVEPARPAPWSEDEFSLFSIGSFDPHH